MSASRAARGPACSSGSQATRTGTRAVSSSRPRTSAGSSASGSPGGPRLTRGGSAPPAAAIRSRISRASVGVLACTSGTAPPVQQPGQVGLLAHDALP